LVTVSALGVALYSANSAFLKTKGQLDELSSKTGLIPIDDPAMVYVRPLHRPAPMVYTFQVAIPASKRFKLLVGEGVGESLDIFFSTEISGPRQGFMHPPQQTISVYLQKTARGWQAGYVNAGGSGGGHVGSKQLNWMQSVDKLGLFWNPPPSIQRKIKTYTSDQTIYLLTANENDRRSSAFPGQAPTKVENPRKFAIWLEPMESD
jgi:hypothetical protein